MGLGKETPLSPYLFVIVMEIFSLVVKNKVNQSPSFRFNWRCDKLKITHLCFADDVLTFCRGDVGSIKVLKEALELFSSYYGFMANALQSNLFLFGVADSKKLQIAQELEFQEVLLPIRRLGVPLITTEV